MTFMTQVWRGSPQLSSLFTHFWGVAKLVVTWGKWGGVIADNHVRVRDVADTTAANNQRIAKTDSSASHLYKTCVQNLAHRMKGECLMERILGTY